MWAYGQVRGAVEDLSREILTIEAQGDKPAALELLTKYAKLTPELSRAFASLESVQVSYVVSRTSNISDLCNGPDIPSWSVGFSRDSHPFARNI